MALNSFRKIAKSFRVFEHSEYCRNLSKYLFIEIGRFAFIFGVSNERTNQTIDERNFWWPETY